MTTAIDALARECDRVGTLLESLSGDDWARPTRCPPLTVFELAAHAWRGHRRILEMLDAGPVNAEPEHDGATYFDYDPAQVAPEVVVRAQQTAATLDPASLARSWRRAWDEALARARTMLAGDDPVLPGAFGLIRLSEYLRTRAVEVVVHHMDLRDALGMAPDPDPDALEVVHGVLCDLLGTDPRPLGMDAVRFALTGTGREKLNEGEREAFGPLAKEFPLLS